MPGSVGVDLRLDRLRPARRRAPARPRCTAPAATSAATGRNYVPTKAALARLLAEPQPGATRRRAPTPRAKRALLPHLTTLDTVRDMDADPGGAGRGEDQLLRLLLRHLPRPGLRDPLPDAGRAVRPRRRGEPPPGLVRRQPRPGPRLRREHGRVLALPRPHTRGPSTSASAGEAIKRGLLPQLRRLDRKPAAGGRLGPDELADVMLDAGYYVYNWVELGLGYSALVRKRRGGAARPLYRESEHGRRQQLRDLQRRAVLRRAVAGLGAAPVGTRWAVHRRAPFLTWGNTWYNAPCLTWKAPDADPPGGRPAQRGHLEDPADQRDPRRGHAVLRRAGRAPAVPDRLARRRDRRHHPRQLAVGGALRRQHRGELPAHRHRAAAAARQRARPALLAPAAAARRAGSGAGTSERGDVDRLLAAAARALIAAQRHH